MSEMIMVNLRLPKKLSKKTELAASKGYLSTGEFVRFSIVRFLSQLRIIPQFLLFETLRDEVQKSMKKKHELFSPEKEISELRKLRVKLWGQKHESSA